MSRTKRLRSDIRDGLKPGFDISEGPRGVLQAQDPEAEARNAAPIVVAIGLARIQIALVPP